MNFITGKHLDRRAFLRGTGVSVAFPFLDAMVPAGRAWRDPAEGFTRLVCLEEDLGHVLDHIFIVVNAYNATFKLAKEALEALQTHYPEYLLPTIIRQCTKFAQASSEGVPVFVADPACKGALDIQAAIAHVLPRLASTPPRDGAQRAG